MHWVYIKHGGVLSRLPPPLLTMLKEKFPLPYSSPLVWDLQSLEGHHIAMQTAQVHLHTHTHTQDARESGG